jgi:regulator of RNase E activity RraA
MKKCGISCCPADAYKSVKCLDDVVVLHTKGGEGCLREVADMLIQPKAEEENAIGIQQLCSGLFSDAMDSIGYRNQIISGFLRNQNIVRFMGRARTVLLETFETDDENIKMGLGFIGCLCKGDVLLVEGSNEFAYFGEMMTRLSIRQGIEGVVIGGMTRDTIFTHDNCSLPVLAKGYTPVDIKGRGRVKAVDVPIKIDGVLIESGDLIFADNDAVCVVPKVIEDALLKAVYADAKEESRIVELINKNVTVDEILSQVKSF